MITYFQAATHAARCGILGAGMLAVPISEFDAENVPQVMLAVVPLDPEDCRPLGHVGDVMSAEQLAKLALDYGLDYVIARV